MPEITFILEPDCGRVTVETSKAEKVIAEEIKQILGHGTPLNCARPSQKREEFNIASDNNLQITLSNTSATESIHLFRIYHESTVDGPGKRSVIQVAGCTILCPGCYIPETHEQTNGKVTPITEIISEIEKRSSEHDGVTILGGEPFDQPESLKILVENLNAKGYHLVIYSGYTLENLLARNSETIFRILAKTNLLIDGPFKREMTTGTGEYRGSGNQRLIFNPIKTISNQKLKD